MIYKKPCPPNSVMVPVTYCFRRPCRLTIEDKSGKIRHMSYGIGDKVLILEPNCQYLVVCLDTIEKIPMSDGSFIVDYPEDISYVKEKYEGVYG